MAHVKHECIGSGYSDIDLAMYIDRTNVGIYAPMRTATLTNGPPGRDERSSDPRNVQVHGSQAARRPDGVTTSRRPDSRSRMMVVMVAPACTE
jgi:hypothetical protein